MFNLTEEQARELARNYNMGASSEEAAKRDIAMQREKELKKVREWLEPLLVNTEYHLELSGEKTQVIYNLKKGNEKGRVLGFKILQNEREKGEGKGNVRIFFNHEVYLRVKEAIGLPKNDLSNKTQDHIYITQEKLWDCIEVITGKRDSK